MTATDKDIERLAQAIEEADKIVVGAGAGLSTAAGFSYTGERFRKWAGEHEDRYGFHDFYSGGFYPFDSLEEFWGFWCCAIMANRYEAGAGKVYTQLRELLEGRDYFVITTNVDHQFQLAGFDKNKLYYTQGDYGLFQCSEPCCEETFDNEQQVRAMYAALQKARETAPAGAIERVAIPNAMVPHCPHCGRPMNMNLRADDTFVQDAGWHVAAHRYRDYLGKCEEAKVLYLELGVGYNTPGIIKYPFWQMTSRNPQATYATVNFGQADTHPYIKDRSIVIDGDIAQVVSQLALALK